MSMVNSQKEIKGKSLVGLVEELEASIREAARKGKSLYEGGNRPVFRHVRRQRRIAVEAAETMRGTRWYRSQPVP